MTKMRFNRDMYYRDQETPLYRKDVVYDIEPNMVDRWLKRGGEIVHDKVVSAKVEAAKAPAAAKGKEPVEADKELSEDEVKSTAQKNSPPLKGAKK